MEKKHTSNNKVVIVEGFRTPFARSGRQFKDMPAEELGTYLLRELLERTQITHNTIEEIILSNTTSSPDISNIARSVALGAGLPGSIPSATIRTMNTIEPLISSANKIKYGLANTVIAGGVESMSNLSILLGTKLTKTIKKIILAKTWKEKIKLILFFKPFDINFQFIEQSLFIDPVLGLSQGQAMEKLSKDFHISRPEQDEFALVSSQKACLAQKKGKWKEEIVPVFPPADFELVDQDTELEHEMSARYLSTLKPCFDSDYGTITTGNSSFPADGAVLFLIMNAEKAKSLGYCPLATIHSFASISAEDFATKSVPAVSAVEKLLQEAKLNIKDIDLFEIDETFSTQALAYLKIFDPPVKKCNVNGGALALGNALSAGSVRMVLSLAKQMHRQKAEWGLVLGGVQEGMANALLLKNDKC